MSKGKLALRSIYACGFVSFGVADWIGEHQPAPRWFASAVSEGVLFMAITTALLWISLEILLHFVRKRGVWATALAVSVAAVGEPAFYLISAALYGSEHAQLDTWHLLGMFAVMHQLYAIVITLLIAAGIALLFWIARCIEENRQARTD